MWARDICRGEDDASALARAVAEERVRLTEDRDFGELTVRLKLPAIGVVIASICEFTSSLDATAEHLASVIRALDVSCVGALTVVEPGRARQRPLRLG